VPNFTVADTAGTGSVEVYNSHGATINLLIDAFGYFVRQLPTSVTVSESPTTVTYGHESASLFSVTVATNYGEPVPNGETVTTTVGSVTCKVWLKNDKGTCTIDNTALAVGSYPVSATYGGDANLSWSSSSGSSKLTVSKDSTNSTTVSESPTSVTYGNESASVFSVAVTTHYGEPVPNGETVTTTVGSVTCKVWLKSDKGTCTIHNIALAVGSYPVSATYGGDANLSGTSGTSASKLTVNKDASLTAASESPTSVTYGDESASVFSVAITTHDGETVPNAETVTVYVGSAKCTVSLSGGKGTCTIANTALAVGTYSVSANYGGDGNLNSSSGSSASKLTVEHTA
jgi:hypothetical protein